MSKLLKLVNYLVHKFAVIFKTNDYVNHLAIPIQRWSIWLLANAKALSQMHCLKRNQCLLAAG